MQLEKKNQKFMRKRNPSKDLDEIPLPVFCWGGRCWKHLDCSLILLPGTPSYNILNFPFKICQWICFCNFGIWEICYLIFSSMSEPAVLGSHIIHSIFITHLRNLFCTQILPFSCIFVAILSNYLKPHFLVAWQCQLECTLFHQSWSKTSQVLGLM